eukprot:COSAG01_NODE_636_length_14635_cov_18.612617_1_plen_96_part_00
MTKDDPLIALPSPVKVTLNWQVKTTLSIDSYSVFIEKLLKALSLESGVLDISFVTEDEIKKMHQTYLNKNTVTDVITFNLGSQTEPITNMMSFMT